MLFKSRFLKSGQTYRRQVVNPRHRKDKRRKDNQLQSLKLPCRVSKLSMFVVVNFDALAQASDIRI